MTEKAITWKAPSPYPLVPLEDNITPHQAPNKKDLIKKHCSAHNISEDHTTRNITYRSQDIPHLAITKKNHIHTYHIKNNIRHFKYYIFILHKRYYILNLTY